MAESLAGVLSSLLLGRSTAALATLHEGRPAVSMIPFAVRRAGGRLQLVTHVSGLAAHTADMRSCREVSLLVSGPEEAGAMPQSLPRVSIQARAAFFPPDHPDHAACRACYLAKFPDAAGLFQLGDFSIVAFEIESARLVAGFARAVTLAPEAIASALGGDAA
jgi:putative heme iron utilization protein